MIHSVAQYAHCLAQGKVGSGFDISSSVYGTHIYKRFSPSLLEPLLSSNSPPSLVEALDPVKWDQSISPFRLPKGLRLVLADVDAGTNTPSFIRGILKWREEKPEESNEIWGKLFKANTRLVKALEHLRGLEGEEEYGEVLEAAAGLPIEQVRPSSDLTSLLYASPLVGRLGFESNVLNFEPPFHLGLPLDDRSQADTQAGFSAGWSAKPEKTVPIAKSILEIRQALNVSPLFRYSSLDSSYLICPRGHIRRRGKEGKER
jgi:hypothetical protein